MNTKKSLVAALAAAVAVSSVAAVSVSAVGPGTTNDDAKQTIVVEPGKNTHFTVTINDVTIDADVPADAIEAGQELTFGAALITNVDIEAVVNQLPDVATSELLDIYFLDANEGSVSFADAGVSVVITNNATNYETVYIYEDETGLNKLASVEGNKLSFTAPHFSYYVLVKNGTVVPEPSNDNNGNGNNGSTDNNNGNTNNNGSTDNNNGSTNNGGTGVNTGDSTATAAVFAIVGAAALGTALVASKSKKHAK